jgi:hypothetical protein
MGPCCLVLILTKGNIIGVPLSERYYDVFVSLLAVKVSPFQLLLQDFVTSFI